jgi:hypothetical protein
MSVNLTGIWKANLPKSRILGPMPRAITVAITHSDPELHEEIVVTKLDGSEERIVFECSANGEAGKSLLNGRAVDGSARWEGQKLVIESRMQSGTRELHFCDCWSWGRVRKRAIEHAKAWRAFGLTVTSAFPQHNVPQVFAAETIG